MVAIKDFKKKFSHQVNMQYPSINPFIRTSIHYGLHRRLHHYRRTFYTSLTPRRSLNSHNADPLVFRDKVKNKYLKAATKLDDLHKTLSHQQADQLINQIITFEANVASSDIAIQKNLRGIPTELSAPPPTVQLASPTSQLVLQSSQSVLQPQKSRDRLKESKNNVPTFSAAPPFSSALSILTKFNLGR